MGMVRPPALPRARGRPAHAAATARPLAQDLSLQPSLAGRYCGDTSSGNNTVNGKKLGVCLGDEFSVRWMEDTDRVDESKETLGQQFTTVKSAVHKSHVQRYGDFDFVSSPLAAFLGNEPPSKAGARRPPPRFPDEQPGHFGAVDSLIATPRPARARYART